MTSHNLHCEKGFSLIELMIVVVIIGILAAVAVPGYMSHVRKTNQADGIHRILDIKTAQEKFYALNDIYAQDIATLAGMLNFDSTVTDMFLFTISDTSSLTTTYTAFSQNDLDGDTVRRDCWEIDPPRAEPIQIIPGVAPHDVAPYTGATYSDCQEDGEGVNISLF
jgi:prepilin-type N-terminal cleavage/methylation domain-containing protein